MQSLKVMKSEQSQAFLECVPCEVNWKKLTLIIKTRKCPQNLQTRKAEFFKYTWKAHKESFQIDKF